MVWVRCRVAAWLLGVAAGLAATAAGAGENVALRRALDSILDLDLTRHTDVLANDTFEGREAGSRGGTAAARYLVEQFERLGLRPAGVDGDFAQPFGSGYRNLLAMIEGSDPDLKHEVILVGAHYDHVGYGNPTNSYGPFGRIHNGADDNASGTAGLLELTEALQLLEPKPRRSVLIAFWDGEEKGLLGSKHWVADPTISLGRVRMAVNLDMIGRLRNDELVVFGARTMPGLRRSLSECNGDGPLRLSFDWELKENSDHYTFYMQAIPVFMLHTGLHHDYHRPSDDVEKLNVAGIQAVTRFLCQTVVRFANADYLPEFRRQSRWETASTQDRLEQPQPALPTRLGLAWTAPDDGSAGLRVERVVPQGAAARAGLRAGDRLLVLDGVELSADVDFRSVVWSAPTRTEVVYRRGADAEPERVVVELAGTPVRFGVAWESDPGEPTTVLLTRVTEGTPAHRGGLRYLDRIHAVGGREFSSSDEFASLLREASGPVEFTVERSGRILSMSVDLPPIDRFVPAATAR